MTWELIQDYQVAGQTQYAKIYITFFFFAFSMQGHVTDASLEEQRGRELRFLLPLTQARPTILAKLFQQLELQKVALGVASYGLTACSMEEIFVRLTEKDVLEKAEGKHSLQVYIWICQYFY